MNEPMNQSVSLMLSICFQALDILHDLVNLLLDVNSFIDVEDTHDVVILATLIHSYID